MKKTTSKKLNTRLTQYGALAAAIAGVSDATGQIQYTDVDPDETITAAQYMLDVNGDGTVDFTISNTGSMGTGVTPGTTVRVYTDNSSSILGLNAGGNYNYPYTLDQDAPIDDAQATWITAPVFQTLNWNGCAYTNSQWCDGQVDKYLGLRITVGTDQHYGWVRLDMPADASSFTVKDYALNLTPGEGLLAGQQSLGLEDQVFEGFTHFVNDEGLNLKSNTPMSNVDIFNIVGKKVVSQSLNSNRETIDMGALNAGVYIATVAVEGQTKSIKIVKR